MASLKYLTSFPETVPLRALLILGINNLYTIHRNIVKLESVLIIGDYNGKPCVNLIVGLIPCNVESVLYRLVTL